MLGVFAEFERAILVERTLAGIARARAYGTRSGKPIGRPKVNPGKEIAIRTALATGKGVLKTAREVGVGSSVVQRVEEGNGRHNRRPRAAINAATRRSVVWRTAKGFPTNRPLP